MAFHTNNISALFRTAFTLAITSINCQFYRSFIDIHRVNIDAHLCYYINNKTADTPSVNTIAFRSRQRDDRRDDSTNSGRTNVTNDRPARHIAVGRVGPSYGASSSSLDVL